MSHSKNTQQKFLTPKLLTATVAGLISGQALAELAGHVSFVAGDVTATTPDGQTRTLHKGDDINGGDRISTGSGRIQLRFSDGGFVALQPNTVFGVDQYVYANKKPEDSSLFFSLVRGGMRTITGVIGHINKANYRVKTPVATIGIRGTEYLADFDGNMLRVSVGAGSVYVDNDQGNITLVAGESAAVNAGSSPHRTEDKPEIDAPTPDGNVQNNSNQQGQDSHTAGDHSTVQGDQVNTDGSHQGVPTATPTLADSKNGSPVYAVVIPSSSRTVNTSALNTTTPTTVPTTTAGSGFVYTGLSASFDQSLDAASRGGLLTASDASGTVFDHGTLQYNGVTTLGALSYGELTNGSGTSASGNLLLSNNQYFPYLVGVAAAAPASTGMARYSLQGGTTPRLNGSTAGTLDHLNIAIDLGASIMGVDLQLEMSGNTYNALSSNLSVPNIAQSGGFMVTGINTTSTGADCSSGCSTDIGGFFAGSNQLGTAYQVNVLQGTINGVAALQLGSLSPLGVTLADSVSGTPSYSLLTLTNNTSNGTMPDYLQQNLGASFDHTTNLNDRGGLVSVSNVDGTAIFDKGTLNYASQQTVGAINLGEYTNGQSATNTLSGTESPWTLSAKQYQPYLTGQTATSIFPSGSATYSLQAATAPRDQNGNAGVLNQMDLTLNMDYGTLGVNMKLTMPSNSVYTVKTASDAPLLLNDIVGQAGGFSFTNADVTVTGAICQAKGCGFNLFGFLASSNGSQMGTAYSITDNGSQSIGGVAALAITGNPVATSAPVNGPGYAAVYTSSTMGDGQYANGLVSHFDSAGNGLLDASFSANSIFMHRADTSSVQAADVGHAGTLEWGRWISGTPTLENEQVGTALSANDSVHYVVGPQTPYSTMNSLNSQNVTGVYTLTGGTHPTNGTESGTLNSGTLTVNFGALPQMAVDLNLTMASGKDYTVSGSGALPSGGSASFNLTGLATTGSKGACSSGCSTNVSGFFSGSQAERIGMSYSIQDIMSGTVRGAAGFTRGNLTATPVNQPVP